MIDGFFGLRHHAIVCSNHQHHDIGHFCASRAHACECLVARRVNKHNSLSVNARFVCANVLRDPASFSRSDFRFADGVEQAGLAVVHMAHHGDNGGARQLIAGALLFDLLFLDYLLFECHNLYDSVERFRQTCRRRGIQRLVDAGKHAAVHQRLQQILGADVELLRKLANCDPFRHDYFAGLALNGRDGLRLCRAARTGASTCAHRMQLSLAFGIPLLNQRAAA